MKKKLITYTSAWTYIPNPLYFVKCPHCKAEIFMSSPSLIERLKRWARKIIK